MLIRNQSFLVETAFDANSVNSHWRLALAALLSRLLSYTKPASLWSFVYCAQNISAISYLTVLFYPVLQCPVPHGPVLQCSVLLIPPSRRLIVGFVLLLFASSNTRVDELHARLRNYHAFLIIITSQWYTDDISVILMTLLYLTGHCPYVCPSTVSICVDECSSDGDCTDGSLCCSHGCGHSCQQPGRTGPIVSVVVHVI